MVHGPMVLNGYQPWWIGVLYLCIYNHKFKEEFSIDMCETLIMDQWWNKADWYFDKTISLWNWAMNVMPIQTKIMLVVSNANTTIFRYLDHYPDDGVVCALAWLEKYKRCNNNVHWWQRNNILSGSNISG